MDKLSGAFPSLSSIVGGDIPTDYLVGLAVFPAVVLALGVCSANPCLLFCCSGTRRPVRCCWCCRGRRRPPGYSEVQQQQQQPPPPPPPPPPPTRKRAAFGVLLLLALVAGGLAFQAGRTMSSTATGSLLAGAKDLRVDVFGTVAATIGTVTAKVRTTTEKLDAFSDGCALRPAPSLGCVTADCIADAIANAKVGEVKAQVTAAASAVREQIPTLEDYDAQFDDLSASTFDDLFGVLAEHTDCLDCEDPGAVQRYKKLFDTGMLVAFGLGLAIVALYCVLYLCSLAARSAPRLAEMLLSTLPKLGVAWLVVAWVVFVFLLMGLSIVLSGFCMDPNGHITAVADEFEGAPTGATTNQTMTVNGTLAFYTTCPEGLAVAPAFLTTTVGLATESMTEGANLINTMIGNITSDADIRTQCGGDDGKDRLEAAAAAMLTAVATVDDLVGAAMGCGTVNRIYATLVYDGLCTDFVGAMVDVWQSTFGFAFLLTVVLWTRWLAWPGEAPTEEEEEEDEEEAPQEEEEEDEAALNLPPGFKF
jgi:hypothetical protein